MGLINLVRFISYHFDSTLCQLCNNCIAFFNHINIEIMNLRSLSMLLLVIGLMSQGFTLSNSSSISKEVKSSSIVWKGYKVTGSHEGTISLKSGSLDFDGETLTGGSFIIDMTSIACTDLEGEYKGKLEGHLKSEDFFGVDKFETSNLEITKLNKTGKNSYEASGLLTMKGITKSTDFQISVYGSKASANLKIDRTEFGIKYGSGSFFSDLKDKAIYDEFDLNVDVEF